MPKISKKVQNRVLAISFKLTTIKIEVYTEIDKPHKSLLSPKQFKAYP
jgi:hypothetical protein